MKLYYSLTFFLFFISCAVPKDINKHTPQPLTSYVNPFIGTGAHGHTYPGTTLPFGMMQLSPDTRLDGWDGCSGYHYSDGYIYGFTHTHLSGTGVSDYGDILLMPTNTVNFNNGSNGERGYRAPFSHENEMAEPGYYSVHLDQTDIDVALTISARCGIHQYEFPESENQIAILDLVHRDKVLDTKIDIISSTEIEGHRHSSAWATDQRLFFYMKTSHPFTSTLQSSSAGEEGGRRMALQFSNPKNEPVFIKVGISPVDIDGAKNNLEQEIGTKSFDQVKNEAHDTWEKQLKKITVESKHVDYLTNFYTALYHVSIAPNLYQDIDGRYRGMDMQIHQNTDFNYYTVFSLWDTYRAVHPLYTIIEQERTNDFINTFLAKQDEGGIMPIWDLSGNYTGCMIGYHAVPVIADAYLKGIRGYDTEKALGAMIHSASQDKLGLDSYKKYGFIPVEYESESVSKTLEYAYDDWTIAQMAKSMGKKDIYKEYIERAQYYKNVFEPETEFMRGRFRNTWFAPFDPYEVNFNYTEANSWQYSYYVPQDMSGYINLLGGKKELESNIDELFSASTETSGRHQGDITGLIGQYAHGNEPSHHIAYLYNYVNKPYKTQEKVHQILTELYSNTPEGISGNEDCGQMSAWYIFSALGFYPVTPGSNDYVIGTPLFEKAVINLENGKQFKVTTENLSDKNKYIYSAQLNGKALNQTFLTHQSIIEGGNLHFIMTDQPSDWGTKIGAEPISEIKEHLIVTPPYISKGEIAFYDSTEVELKSNTQNATIHYSIDGDDYQIYKGPVSITEASTLTVYAELNDKRSPKIETQFFEKNPELSISLSSEYANQYNAGGKDALIDGILGTEDFRTGTWQGYYDTDVIATVDLGRVKQITEVKANFLQNQRSWIFFPTEVQCLVSVDGDKFTPLTDQIAFEIKEATEEVSIGAAIFNNSGNYRYVKIIATSLGTLPDWHLGYKHDGRSWVFIDEIIIK